MKTYSRAAPAPTAADRLLPGDEIISAEEALELGLETAPPDIGRSDSELKLAARRGQEDYHG